MLIAIDANELCLKKISGVKSYTYNLLKSLIKLDRKNNFVLYSKSEFQNDFKLEISQNKNFSHKIIKWPFPFWTYSRFSLELLRKKPDVLFMPIQAIPFFAPKCKIIVTIHDLAFLKFPSDFTFKDRFTLSFHTRRALKHAYKIITPSQSTKNDLIKLYKADPNKIKVIYHGVAEIPPLTCLPAGQAPPKRGRTIIPPPLGEVRRGNYKIQKPYILFVGSIQPRKNIQNLIKAFEILNSRPACRQARFRIPDLPAGRQGSRFKLVIAGPNGWLYKDIFKTANKSKYKEDIIFTGQVSEEELSNLYKNAELLILPSLYEGFGFPILEAMSCGIPVITSNVSSMPEISGNAALLINNPSDPNEIAEAMNKLLTNPNLKQELIKKGFENVKRFGWERCAGETLEVLINS